MISDRGVLKCDRCARRAVYRLRAFTPDHDVLTWWEVCADHLSWARRSSSQFRRRMFEQDMGRFLITEENARVISGEIPDPRVTPTPGVVVRD